MSDYSQVTSFGPKDALVSGNPAKKIRGTEYDTEFAAISTAIATKFDDADLASDAEAAALTSETKLLTPDKLSYALQNASVTLGANVLLSGGVAVSDIARKSTANTFTADQTISATAPRLLLVESDQGTDAKYWAVRVVDGVLAISTLDDDGVTVGGSAINIVRDGLDVSIVNIVGEDVLANGSTIWTANNDGTGSGLDADVVRGQTVLSGTYTATTSGLVNLSTATNNAHQYIRVGSVVTVSGAFSVTGGTVGQVVQFDATLPVASDITVTGHLAGAGVVGTAVARDAVSIDGNVSANSARFSWVSSNNGALTLYYTYTYRVN